MLTRAVANELDNVPVNRGKHIHAHDDKGNGAGEQRGDSESAQVNQPSVHHRAYLPSSCELDLVLVFGVFDGDAGNRVRYLHL